MFEVRGLSKSYGKQKIVKDVQFFLPAGNCLGVIGDNGCGKSTLLRMLAQIERPDHGDILFSGRSVLGNRKFLRQHLGYVPQNNDLAGEMTVRQQLQLWQYACGVRKIPEELVSLLGLEPIWGSQICRLSGGTQRRVSIAMALSSEPDILVMDEATTGLDQSYCVALLDWLEQFLHRGGRMIWCSHQSHELKRLCGNCLDLSRLEE